MYLFKAFFLFLDIDATDILCILFQGQYLRKSGFFSLGLVSHSTSNTPASISIQLCPSSILFFSINSSITQTSLTNYMFSKIKLFSDLLVVKFLPLQLFFKLMVHICYQLGLRMGTRIFKRHSCLLVFFYCVQLNF